MAWLCSTAATKRRNGDQGGEEGCGGELGESRGSTIYRATEEVTYGEEDQATVGVPLMEGGNGRNDGIKLQ